MRSRTLAAVVAACIMIGFAGPGSVATAASPRVDRGGPGVVEWIDRHARRLATTDPAEPVGDLRPLGEGDDPDDYTMTVPSLRGAFDALVFVRHTTASRLIGR